MCRCHSQIHQMQTTTTGEFRVSRMKLPSVFDASEIKSEFKSAGINSNFVIPIWKYVIQNPDCVWDEIPSLPCAAYSLLHSKFKTPTSALHSLFHSSDGTTSKLLIQLQASGLPCTLATPVSYVMTLFEGDFILTGTPEGIGPVKIGQKITAGITGFSEVQFDVGRRV